MQKSHAKGSRCSNPNVCSFPPSTPVTGVSISDLQSVALINGHKSSKSHRATNHSPCHHIPICHGVATWPNDSNLKWMLRIYTAPYTLDVPIFQHDTCRFPCPNLCNHLQGMSCLPWVSQMSHRLWEKRRYHRRKTRLQLHQSCSRQLPKSACRTEQDDGKTSQVQLRI